MPLRLLDAALVPAPGAGRTSWLGQGAYAHRGVHDDAVAENSPSAFRRAVAAGLGIECDVRTSSDGRAIVFHDADLERLTGQRGSLANMTADQLSAMQLAVGGESIPTLRDLAGIVAGRVPLIVEMKVDAQSPALPLFRAVREDLATYAGDVAVMSFDSHILRLFRAEAPDILRGLVLTQQKERGLADRVARHRAFWRAKPDFLAYDIRDLPSRFAAAQRARGLPVLSWTVSTPQLRDRAAQFADAPIAEGSGLAQSASNP